MLLQDPWKPTYLVWPQRLLCFIKANQPEAWHLVVLVVRDVQVVRARALDATGCSSCCVTAAGCTGCWQCCLQQMDSMHL
jgi:hypothetical protein